MDLFASDFANRVVYSLRDLGCIRLDYAHEHMQLHSNVIQQQQGEDDEQNDETIYDGDITVNNSKEREREDEDEDDENELASAIIHSTSVGRAVS